MPKIDAPTVAEHHTRRRAALLAAAEELIAADTVNTIPPATFDAFRDHAREALSARDRGFRLIEAGFEGVHA